MRDSWTPTPRLWALLGVALGLTLGGAVVPGLERLAFPVDLVLLALTATSGIIGLKRCPVVIQRRVRPTLSVRGRERVELDVENVSDRRVRVDLLDEPPAGFDAAGEAASFQLTPGEVRTHAYEVAPTLRGDHVFYEVAVRYEGPLGLSRVVVKLPVVSRVRVFPNIQAVDQFELLDRRGHARAQGMRRARMRGLGTEFESLRDYNDDDVRFVDWNSTARRGRLVAKNFENERNQSVIICLDTGRHMLGEVGGVQKLDHMLDAALMLARTASQGGDQVGLLAFDDTVRTFLPPRKGRAHTARTVEAFHDLRATAVQPNYAGAFAFLQARWKRRSLLVLFTDCENDDQAATLAEALMPLRRNHVLLVVRVADPETLGAVTTTTEGELFEAGARLWYASERRKGDVVLLSCGVPSIEAEPGLLAGALVSRYLALKEMARI